jgi:hypothetical protein
MAGIAATISRQGLHKTSPKMGGMGHVSIEGIINNLGPVRDLLLCAKHLFVAAIEGSRRRSTTRLG